MRSSLYSVLIAVFLITLVFINSSNLQLEDDKAFSVDHVSLSSLSSSVLSRSSDLPSTVCRMEGGDPKWIDSSRWVVQRKAGYLEMSDTFPERKLVVPVESGTTQNLVNSRMMQRYRQVLYVAYMTHQTSPVISTVFHLTISKDGGNSWEGPVRIFQVPGHLYGRCELFLYQDKIFYLYSILSTSSAVREFSVKVVPLQNWRNLTSTPSTNLEASGNVLHTKMNPLGNRVVVFWKYEGASLIYFRVYNNGTWSSIQNFINTASSFSAITSDMTGEEKIHIVYADSSGGRILESNTADPILSWSSGRTLVDLEEDVAGISGVAGNDMIHLGISYYSIKEISYGALKDGSTLVLEKVASYSTNYLDGETEEIMISSRGSDVMISFEDSPGIVHFVISRDGGPFSERMTFGAGLGHSPSMDQEFSMICFLNGTNMEIYSLITAAGGFVRTVRFSPFSLSSWKDLGFSIQGIDKPDMAGFRIRDPDTMSQVFPVSGTVDIWGLGPGSIEGRNHDHVINLSGPWTNGSTLLEVLLLELEFSGDPMCSPILFGISLNYSVGYPYTDNLEHEEHILLRSNLTLLPVGLELDPGHDTGWAIFGPVEIESIRPQHLFLNGSFLGSGNCMKASILNSQLETVSGFSKTLSTQVEVDGSEVNIKWEGRNIMDLPATIRVFFIKVHFEKGTSICPVLNDFELGLSTKPELLGVSIEKSSITRGEMTYLEFDPMDREDPVEHLAIEVKYRGPSEKLWQSEGLSDPYWDGTSWVSHFMSNVEMASGFYDFQARVTDDTGLSTQWIEIVGILEIRNNVPKPPMISMEPPLPKVTDTVEFSMLRPGEDVEIVENDLTYNIYLIGPDEVMLEYRDLPEPEMEVNGIELRKHDTWEVHATTWDGENESIPYSIDFTVENSPPRVTGHFPEQVVTQEDVIWTEYSFMKWFRDDDGDDLDVLIDFPEDLEVEIESGNFQIAPRSDHNGMSYIRMRIDDGEASIDENISVVITPVNDRPVWNTDIKISIRQDQWAYVDIGAEDPKDGEDVNVQIDFPAELLEYISGDNLFIYPNGSFRFKPDNNMIGRHKVNFRIIDSEHELKDELTLEVLNVNDPPVIKGASTERNRHFYMSGEKIVLEGNAYDPDIMWGDSVYYHWSSHFSGPLGNGSTIVASLPPGNHQITLTVLDSLGQSDNFTFMITVASVEDKGDPLMRTWVLFTLSGSISFIVSILFAVVIITSIVGKRRSKGETSDPKATRKDDQIDGYPPRAPDLGLGALPEKAENGTLHELPPYIEKTDNGIYSGDPVGEGGQGDNRDSVAESAGDGRWDGGDTNVR